MRSLSRIACISLLAAGMIPGFVIAQDPPALIVAPAKATMLVGETHMFRAVGKDGSMRHNVRWSVSPEHAATLIAQGDEVMVRANEPSSTVILTAYAEGDSSEATVEIRSGNALPLGTVKWSVPEIPGCKDKKIIPAVPRPGGPDIFVQEDCPQGTFVRAIMEDGRELWRRQISGPGAGLPAGLAAKATEEPAERLNLHATSVCDAVSSGMSKEETANLVTARQLRLEDKPRQSDTWTLEEEGFRCTISFDGKTGAVVKKKKTIVTD